MRNRMLRSSSLQLRAAASWCPNPSELQDVRLHGTTWDAAAGFGTARAAASALREDRPPLAHAPALPPLPRPALLAAVALPPLG